LLTGWCGHDALWNGDTKLFEKLKDKNLQKIKECGIKKIVFSCPECYRTFKKDYPDMGVELLHISEFLNDKEMPAAEDSRNYTLHDSCRLGRHLGIYDEPRAVLERAGAPVHEMEHSRDMAICCGTSAWMNCDWMSEEIRKDRLREAAQVADVLVTTCPKCQIHFKCTLSHTDADIEVKDFVEVVAERIA
jgi:Fe-S oxidoreductase